MRCSALLLAALLCASAAAKSVAEWSAKAAPKWPPKPKPQKTLQRAPDIRVDCATVRNSPVSPLVNWTRSDYAQFAAQPAGAEHYKLLSHLASQVGAGSIVEVGTRYGAGALASSYEVSQDTKEIGDLVCREFESEMMRKKAQVLRKRREGLATIQPWMAEQARKEEAKEHQTLLGAH